MRFDLLIDFLLCRHSRISLLIVLLMTFIAPSSSLHSADTAQVLDYTIGWGIVPVARATLETDGLASKLSIRSVGVANWLYPVDTMMSTVLAADLSRSLEYRRRQKEGRGGRYHRDIRIRFDWDNAVAIVTNYDEPQPDIVLEGPVYDPLATLTVFRHLDLTSDTVHRLNVADGSTVNPHAIAIGGVEEISTPVGVFSTFRVTPSTENFGGAFKESTDPTLFIWLTDQKPHLLVKIESQLKIGSFRLLLNTPIEHPSMLGGYEPIAAPTRHGRR